MKKLIPLLLMLVAMPSMAQRQFDIEVIIFKRAVDAEQTAESWPANLPKIDLERAGTFADASYRAKKGVQMLPYSEYALTDEVQKLKQHAGFEVLMHKAWRQGDQGRLSAPTFHIQAGYDFSSKFNTDGSMIGTTGQQVLEGVTEQSIPKAIYQLDGKLQIYVEHYLYADVELDLKAPSVREVTLEEHQPESLSDQSSDENQVVQIGLMEDVTPIVHKEEYLKSYRLDQKRRMRSSETHFLDHPLMGMIIQVRRVN
ncbi:MULTISPECIES: peptidoglycan binding protein CsiV [unclassified Vibrio]|uniref:peptidoglycan binding protein CsiV n=1 Tax=unclassified Vibrio TaxID=2614977 RepID=UPI002F4050A4